MTHGKIEKLIELSRFRTTENILITEKIIIINAKINKYIYTYSISDLFRLS